MRQGWFDRVDEMLRTVEESAKEQWNCSAIEELFEEKVSTSYTIISAIGPSPQDGHGNRRSVSIQALIEFLQEFQTILQSAPHPEAIEAARKLFKEKVKSRSYQEPERTDKLEADPANPELSTIPTSEHLDPISREQVSASSITSVEVANHPLSDRLHAEEMNATESLGSADCEEYSLRHANWECRYYIAFIPRCMTYFETHRGRLANIFKELKEQNHCESGYVLGGHVEMIISVPPYSGVGSVIKYLRDCSSLRITEGLKDFDQIGPGQCYWARTYFAPLANFDLAAIQKLMAKRVRED
jgi:REP element-mobilizing transposase RayT